MSHIAIRSAMLFLGLGFLLGNVWYMQYNSLLLVFTGFVWVGITLIPKRAYEKAITLLLLFSASVVHIVFVFITYSKVDSSMKMALLMIGLVYFLAVIVSSLRNKIFFPIE